MKNMRKTAVLLALCMAFSMMLAGCGGGGETDPVPEVYTEPYDYDLSEYISVDGYKGVEISQPSFIVTGDNVNIDFVGTIDGVAFEGGSTTPGTGGVDMQVGSGQFLEDFEQAVIGYRQGETVEFDMKFPDSYFNEEVAGKTAHFVITINSVDKDENQRADAWNEVVSMAEVLKYPDAEKARYIQELDELNQSYAERAGMSFSDFKKEYLYMTDEDYEQYLEDAAEFTIKREMTAYYIARKEGLAVTDEDYQEGIIKILKDEGFESEESFITFYGMPVEQALGKRNIMIKLTTDKVIDFIIENAVWK